MIERILTCDVDQRCWRTVGKQDLFQNKYSSICNHCSLFLRAAYFRGRPVSAGGLRLRST
jgi:hypothetical protein